MVNVFSLIQLGNEVVDWLGLACASIKKLGITFSFSLGSPQRAVLAPLLFRPQREVL